MLLHRNFHHLVLVFDLRHIHHLAKLLQLVSLALADRNALTDYSTFNATWLAKKKSVIHIFNVLLAVVTILLYWIVFYCTFCWLQKKISRLPLLVSPLAPKKSWQVDAFCTFWIIGTCTWVWTGTSTTCRRPSTNGVGGADKLGSYLTKLLHIGFHEGSCLGPLK